MDFISVGKSLISVTGNDSEMFRRLSFTDKPNINGELTPLNPQKDIETRKNEIRKAAEGFEAIFTRQLLKTMRSAIIDKSMFGEGPAGDIYGEILDGAVADKMASKGDLGIADMLYSSMLKKLEMDKNIINSEKVKVNK